MSAHLVIPSQDITVCCARRPADLPPWDTLTGDEQAVTCHPHSLDQPVSGPCEHCYVHEATDRFAYEGGGGLALVHGAFQFWCRCCVLKAQVEHAEKAAARLEALRAELAAACPAGAAYSWP